MKIAVGFDGAGLARLGLEQAGHECVGIELNPIAHYLSKFVGSGNSILGDVKTFDFSGYDGAWLSPPCQLISSARTQGAPISDFAENLLNWSLDIQINFPNIKTFWVENVMVQNKSGNDWGQKWNAAQFLGVPIQNRNRIVSGIHPIPKVYRSYSKAFKNVCPCITATEYKGCATDTRRASRYYGRRLTIEECAYHQGFEIPGQWYIPLPGFTKSKWYEELYRAIGNGVPPYMTFAFGEVLK